MGYRLFLPALLGVVCCGRIDFEPASLDEHWFMDDWTLRKQIVIDPSLVDQDIEQFPLLLSVDGDADLRLARDSDDMRFLSLDGQLLAADVELFDPVAGLLRAWVRVPRISSARDTVVYLYFGGQGTDGPPPSTDVWGEGYPLVVHGFSTDGEVLNAATGRPVGSPIVDVARADAVIGGGLALSSGDAEIPVTGGEEIFDGWQCFGFSAWIYPDFAGDSAWTANISERWVFQKEGSMPLARLYHGPGQDIDEGYFQVDPFLVAAGRSVVRLGVTNRQWAHISVGYDGDVVVGIAQGVVGARNEVGLDRLVSSDSAMSIGSYNKDSLTGVLDEVRVWSNCRDAQWLVADARIQAEPGEFVSVGAVEARPGT